MSNLSLLSFKVSEVLTLRLEESWTIIYVNGEEFIQCKGLFVSNPHLYDNIASVDDIKSEVIQEENKFVISPEEEFWGHCSNLQVWFEHNYDARLLHSNIAFPLLKKLAEIGDITASKKLKIEIMERFAEGSASTREYLTESGFIDYLSEEEIRSVLKLEEACALDDLEVELSTIFRLAKSFDELNSSNRITDSLYLIEGAHIVGIRYHLPEVALIPEKISVFAKLRYLILPFNELKAFPNSFYKLRELELLGLSYNKFYSLPVYFEHFDKLKILTLFFNKFTAIPKVLLKMNSLNELYLGGNPIQYFPKSIGNLSEKSNNYFIKV